MSTKEKFMVALKMAMMEAYEHDQQMVDQINQAVRFEQLGDVIYEGAGNGNDAFVDLVGFMDGIE
jgi:hypothetical protein